VPLRKEHVFSLFPFTAPLAASRQKPIFSGGCLEAAPGSLRKLNKKISVNQGREHDHHKDRITEE
jgi:hypothetical protein